MLLLLRFTRPYHYYDSSQTTHLRDRSKQASKTPRKEERKERKRKADMFKLPSAFALILLLTATPFTHAQECKKHTRTIGYKVVGVNAMCDESQLQCPVGGGQNMISKTMQPGSVGVPCVYVVSLQ